MARALVMEDRAVEMVEGIERGEKSKFTDQLIEVLAMRVTTHVTQKNAYPDSLGNIVKKQHRLMWFVCALGIMALLTACVTGAWAYTLSQTDERSPRWTHRIAPVDAQPIRFQVESEEKDTPNVWDWTVVRSKPTADTVLVTRQEIDEGTMIVLTHPDSQETLSVWFTQ